VRRRESHQEELYRMNDRTPTPNEAATVRRLAGAETSPNAGRMWVKSICTDENLASEHDANAFLGQIHAAGAVVSDIQSSIAIDEESNWTQIVITYRHHEEVV